MEHRNTIWIPAQDRIPARDAVAAFVATATMLPAVRAHLQKVHAELDVCALRSEIWFEQTQIARIASAEASTSLPLQISEDERMSLLAVPTLPEAVRLAVEGSADASRV